MGKISLYSCRCQACAWKGHPMATIRSSPDPVGQQATGSRIWQVLRVIGVGMKTADQRATPWKAHIPSPRNRQSARPSASAPFWCRRCGWSALPRPDHPPGPDRKGRQAPVFIKINARSMPGNPFNITHGQEDVCFLTTGFSRRHIGAYTLCCHILSFFLLKKKPALAGELVIDIAASGQLTSG